MTDLLKTAREFVDLFKGADLEVYLPGWAIENFNTLSAAVLNEEALRRAEATTGDALMFGIAGLTRTGRKPSEPEMQNIPGTGADFVDKITRGRFVGKAPELGMGYGGQQAPKDGDFYAAMAEILWADDRSVKTLTDEDRERYRKEKTARLGLSYRMGLSQYMDQMRSAAVWEADHNRHLRDTGWQWDPERLCWWHLWHPGTTISPG